MSRVAPPKLPKTIYCLTDRTALLFYPKMNKPRLSNVALVKNLSEITTHPELNRIALKNNLDTPYLLWCVLRGAVADSNLSSHFTRKSAYAIVLKAGLSFSKRHFNRVLIEGSGLFWGLGAKVLYLRSFDKVYNKLADDEAVRIPSARFVKIHVEKSALKRRAELYWSWLYSKQEITIARDSMQELTGCSHDQQRAYEKHLGSRLSIKTNYCHIDADLYKDNLENIPTYAYSFIQEKFANNVVEMVNVIAYQMPNTYIASKPQSHVSWFEFAPKRALSATRTLYRQARACSYNERCYYDFYDQWEKVMSAYAYIRCFYQGKKRIWRMGHFF